MEDTRFAAGPGELADSLARHVKLGVETQPRWVVQPYLFRFGKRIRRTKFPHNTPILPQVPAIWHNYS
jgi:hypothetical protein